MLCRRGRGLDAVQAARRVAALHVACILAVTVQLSVLWRSALHVLTVCTGFCGPLQITEAVAPVRERMDACLVFPSMPAVMKLNKLGTFSMAQLGQSKSIFSDFMKSARKVRRAAQGGTLPNDVWMLRQRWYRVVQCRARPCTAWH